MGSLLSLHYYTRLCYSAALTTMVHILGNILPWRLRPRGSKYTIALSSVLSLGLIPLAPLVLS